MHRLRVDMLLPSSLLPRPLRLLQTIAEDSGNVEKDPAGDTWVAPLDARQEVLVHCEHLDILGGNDISRALMVTDQPHLAKNIAAPVLSNMPGLGGRVDKDVRCTGDQHI